MLTYAYIDIQLIHVQVFDPITKNVMCTGSKSVIKEGHKSFPSGHTSCKQFDISGKLYIEGLEIRDVLNVL